MNKTHATKAKEITRTWHIIDAKGQILGRMTTDIAKLLIGKDKVNFSSHLDNGDYVVVINAKEVAVTGNKEMDKKYYRYSGYPSGLTVLRLEEVREKYPDRIIRTAVSGMLPKNKLRDVRLARLKVYADSTHPHINHFQKIRPKLPPKLL